MIIPGVSITSPTVRPIAVIGEFRRLATRLTPTNRGELITLSAEATTITVEWLSPFSWDAELRGVVVRERRLEIGQRMVLHAGPYGTADAVAASAGTEMRFPSAGEGHRYTGLDGPGAEDVHQDAAGWVVVDLGGRCLVLAWDYSGTVTTVITREGGGVTVSVRLPLEATGSPADVDGPELWLAVVDGGLDAGAAALRGLATDRFVVEPDLASWPGAATFPPLVANSWGVGEDTSTSRVLAMMEATAAIGAEVFVVDKGWERAVGDWHPNVRFAAPEDDNGLGWLSARARERGMGFGVWCGFGSADPAAPVAVDHPDWVASWRGTVQVLSFDNLGLCLGHDPARDWVLDELRRMVDDFGLTWLIHDFETIARCDRADHTHGVGGGDRAAEAAWHHVLDTVIAERPGLVVENCWNGGRPLDLGMVRSHHTTITEDHCRVHWNALAKVALGRYLPLDWQSSYLGTEDLAPRARIAPYVVGGPWVLMDDPATWDPGTRATLERAAVVYKAWRRALRTARISRPDVELRDPLDDRRLGPVDAVQANLTDGRAIMAISVPPGVTAVTVRPTWLHGAHQLIDEWTGAVRSVTLDDRGLTLPVDPAGDGLLVSFVPQV